MASPTHRRAVVRVAGSFIGKESLGVTFVVVSLSYSPAEFRDHSPPSVRVNWLMETLAVAVG